MLTPPPAKILLHDAMQDIRITLHQAKRRRQHDVRAMVKDRIVVRELHIIRPDRVAFAFGAEDVARLEYFGNEHGPFASRRRREEVEILPDGATNGARNADVVFQTRPTSRNGFLDELLDCRATLRPQLAARARLSKLMMAGGITDHEATKATVGDENIGTEAE